MKLLLVCLALAAGPLAQAQTIPNGLTVLTASFTANDNRGVNIYKALVAAGALSSPTEHGALAIQISNIYIRTASNEPQFTRPGDPCVNIPSSSIQFQDQQNQDRPGHGKWTALNLAQACSGAEYQLTKNILSALAAVGYNVVSGSLAMGGQSTQSVTDLVASSIASVGALGNFGQNLSEMPN